VVYHRVDAQNDLEDSISVHFQEESSRVEPLKKISRLSCMTKYYAFCGLLLALLSLIFLILLFCVIFRFYSNVNQCYFTRHYDNKTTIFKDTSIENINFKVISGIVDITFHNEPYVTVDIKNKYRHESFEKKDIISGVTLNHGTIQITSETPAFNLQDCLHSHIHIALPHKYQKTISLTGFINTGYVHVHGNTSNALDKVDLVVQVGAINIEKLSSKSISLSTDLGCIEVSESVAVNSAKLFAHTGSIRSHDLISKDVIAITKYGRSLHKGLVSDVIVVDTKWGYSSVYGAVSPANHQDITVKTEYGKSVLALENNNLDFHLENQRGHMLVEYEDEKWDCKLETKTGQTVLMKGKCDTIKKEKSNSRVNVNLDTQYGNSILLVDQIKKD